MNKTPEELKYTAKHEWARKKEKENTAVIGITDFAQDALGDIVYVAASAEVGQSVSQFDEIATLESVKAASEAFSPLSGKIIEVNPKLESNPGLVNSDPYGEGWLFRIELSNADELKTLLSAEDYKKQTSAETH